MGGRNSQLLKN